MKVKFKPLLKHVLAIVVFLVLVLVYFAPSIFEGKAIPQGDIHKYAGAVHEIQQYAKTDVSKDYDVIGWTGSMFSGMPSYTISVEKAPANFLRYLEIPLKALDSSGGTIVLLGMICFYILMCVLGVNFWLALVGAVAFAFSSYNFIIIEAGHITKAYAIAYMPLVIAGMVLIFKNKWILGAALTILGVALSLKANHIQIIYYLIILCVILYLIYLFQEIKNKDFVKLGKVTGILIICVLLGILPNVGGLYSNYEMGKESIRGKSELTATTEDERVSSGLDIDYAFAWSYGKAETMTLLIPNFYGGATGGELDETSALYEAMRRNGMQAPKKINTYTYWGDQPFTSGPVYFGAVICFLFVLGMFVIKSPAKWWLFGGVIFFVFLSWGKNLNWFNEFLFHYLPMYNKFRTPSMALVIPGLIFPIIGIWGLMNIFTQKVEKDKLKKSFYWAFGITGGLCFIFWIMPGLFLDFESVNDIQLRSQVPDWYYNALLEDRESLLRKDAFRSLIYIVLSAGLIFWLIKSKNTVNTSKYAMIGIFVLVLADLWMVDKRYINNDSFISKKQAFDFPLTNADRLILQDKDVSYRVFNLNNPFQESNTSYYHKSIGGYNAAKLRRYQELVDHRIMNEMRLVINNLQQAQTFTDLQNMPAFAQTPTLNMLNAKYVIFDPEQPPIVNNRAYGNAWFVNNYEIVEDADAEIAALNRINPLQTAVIDKQFLEYVSNSSIVPNELGTIEMTKYEPVMVEYWSSSPTEQLAVFSEIYYPHGWQSTIDGQPVEHIRADWTLRAMVIPAGEHTIKFEFIPKKYIAAMRIGSISSLFVVLFLIFAVGWSIWKNRKTENQINS